MEDLGTSPDVGQNRLSFSLTWNSCALSVGTKIDDLGWSWMAISYTVLFHPIWVHQENLNEYRRALVCGIDVAYAWVYAVWDSLQKDFGIARLVPCDNAAPLSCLTSRFTSCLWDFLAACVTLNLQFIECLCGWMNERALRALHWLKTRSCEREEAEWSFGVNNTAGAWRRGSSRSVLGCSSNSSCV